MGWPKSCLFSALLDINGQSEAAVEDRLTFFGVQRQTFFGGQQGRQTFVRGQTEIPNAAKTACGILRVRSEPRDGKRIFANLDNFVNKAEKANR